MRASMCPDVQVDERLESSATWRTYQVRTNSLGGARCSADSVTGSPSTRTRSSSGTQRVAVLADHPRVDAAGVDAEHVADRRSAAAGCR